MGKFSDLSARCYVAVSVMAAGLFASALRRRDERGDVPGWVLVVVMSVGLIAAIGIIAEEQLGRLLRRALGSVD